MINTIISVIGLVMTAAILVLVLNIYLSTITAMNGITLDMTYAFSSLNAIISELTERAESDKYDVFDSTEITGLGLSKPLESLHHLAQ